MQVTVVCIEIESECNLVNEMDPNSCHAVASHSKNLALSYIKSEDFGRAFSHLLIALKLEPRWKATLKEPFSAVLFKWGTILEHSNRFSDVFTCYEQAIEVFPDNEFIMDNLGAILLRHGLVKEAAHYFRKSLDIRPSFLRASRNLENVSNLVVPRWHFRMLNDSKRNGAFRDAIHKKIKQGYDVVLDIGTGTGILSLFAMEAGAKKIFACDSSSYMIDIAGQVIKENNASGITLVNKHSRNVDVPDDIPEKVKLVVTEILDCGLLGENVLETLIDAWGRLLILPKKNVTPGAVIPHGANVYISGIECDYIWKKQLIAENASKYFNVNDCHIKCKEDSYDSECLPRVPNGFKYVTNICKTFLINFNDRRQMEKILTGEFDDYIELECKTNGRLDCLVIWFDLYVDEEIVMNTSPDSDSNDSWDQAIFSLPDTYNVVKGDRVTIKLCYKNGRIVFDDFKLSSGFEVAKKAPRKKEHTFRISEELVRMLNNAAYTNCLNELYEMVKREGEDVAILDTFPFPFFGLNYLIRDGGKKNTLKAVVRDEQNRNFVKFLANKHGFEENLQFTVEEKLWEMSENEKYDIIMLNLIERSGELKDERIPLLDHLRSHLKPNGHIIPERVTIMGQLIESEWLEKMSHIIGDSSTFGYKIGSIINSYQVNTHIDFDYHGIPKIIRSEPFEICSVLTGEYVYNLRIPVVEEGNANALAIWYNIKFLNDGPELSTLSDNLTNHVALLFPKAFVTNCMELRIIYDNGLFKIEDA